MNKKLKNNIRKLAIDWYLLDGGEKFEEIIWFIFFLFLLSALVSLIVAAFIAVTKLAVIISSIILFIFLSSHLFSKWGKKIFNKENPDPYDDYR